MVQGNLLDIGLELLQTKRKPFTWHIANVSLSFWEVLNICARLKATGLSLEQFNMRYTVFLA